MLTRFKASFYAHLARGEVFSLISICTIVSLSLYADILRMKSAQAMFTLKKLTPHAEFDIDIALQRCGMHTISLSWRGIVEISGTNFVSIYY